MLYNFKSYHVRKDDELLDMDEVRSLAREHKPRMIVAGASAYSRHWDFRLFKEIADEVGALLMVDMAHIAGLVASGHHPSPVPFADFVTTTTHKTLRGPRGGLVLCKEVHAKALDRSLFPGVQGGPLMHMVAAKAIAFKEAMDPSFKSYSGKVVENAKALSHSLQEKGWRIVSGGTDNHLILVDVFAKGVLGSVAEKALDLAGITINKNGIPFDPNPPMKPSGIRLGTPAITTRGMGIPEMAQVGGWIHRVLVEPEKEASIRQIRSEVLGLTQQFPIPQ
jgi:glycine hydroxymethyltransferase